MKSPMVQSAGYLKPEQKSGYSDLQVLRSGAGYYVGTIYTDPEDGFTEPGSRDSGYFRTHEDAEKYLKLITVFEGAGTRDHP